ncbi:terpene synthase family protein [Lentzea sp.]|uniref:terpene synthase family protein n=1 Tax=Lentzea sp. TaxID=56099 RepID=UPI002ED37FBA
MVEIPAFDMPFAARLSPHVDRVRQHSRQWARDMGMLDGQLWTEEYYDQSDFGSFTPLAHPALGLDALVRISDMHVWAWYVADLFYDGFFRSRDLAGAKAFVARLKSIVDNPSPATWTVVERGLADLLTRAPLDARDKASLFDYFDSLLWEVHCNALGRVPDPVDFVEMRRHTVAADLSARLAAGPLADRLPPDLMANSTMRALVDAFADITSLKADVFGYDRFGPDTGIVTNAVQVVRTFFDCELQQAVDMVADLVNARMRQFATSVEHDLPYLADQYGLDSSQRTALKAYAETLKSWLAGELLWTQRTGRYKPYPMPSPASFRRPTGLGTSAALVR